MKKIANKLMFFVVMFIPFTFSNFDLKSGINENNLMSNQAEEVTPLTTENPNNNPDVIYNNGEHISGRSA